MSPKDGLSAEHVVIERPAPGLARGNVRAPAWAVASFGAAVVVAALAYVVIRLVRRVNR